MVRVQVPRLDISGGTVATYSCVLQAQRVGTSAVEGFSPNAAVSALRLSPQPTPITGSFEWLAAAPTATTTPANSTTTSPGGNP